MPTKGERLRALEEPSLREGLPDESVDVGQYGAHVAEMHKVPIGPVGPLGFAVVYEKAEILGDLVGLDRRQVGAKDLGIWELVAYWSPWSVTRV